MLWWDLLVEKREIELNSKFSIDLVLYSLDAGGTGGVLLSGKFLRGNFRDKGYGDRV